MTRAEPAGSLLSCNIIDKMRPTAYRHDPSQELIGQGLANLSTGLFSGMPVTSVIARSTVNVHSGGQTRLPAVLHGLIVLGGLNTLSPMIAMVPMPTLAAVLVNNGSKMLWPPEAAHAMAVQRTDAMPYLATVFGILSMGLAEGCLIGAATSLVFSGANWNRPETAWMSFQQAQSVRTSLELYSAHRLLEMDKASLIHLIVSNYEKDLKFVMGSMATPDDADHLCPECGGEGSLQMIMSSHADPLDMDDVIVCPQCDGSGIVPLPELPVVWWLNGPLNFLSVFRIGGLMDVVRANKPPHGRCIFDLHGCTGMDITGAEVLLDGLSDLQRDGIKVTLMNAPTEFQAALRACVNDTEQVDVFSRGAQNTGSLFTRGSHIAGKDLDLEKVIQS